MRFDGHLESDTLPKQSAYCGNTVLPLNAEMIGALMQLPLPSILLKPMLSKNVEGKGNTYPVWVLPSPLLPHSAFTSILTLFVLQRVQ